MAEINLPCSFICSFTHSYTYYLINIYWAPTTYPSDTVLGPWMSKKKPNLYSHWAWILGREADIDPIIVWGCVTKSRAGVNAVKKGVVFWDQS